MCFVVCYRCSVIYVHVFCGLLYMQCHICLRVLWFVINAGSYMFSCFVVCYRCSVMYIYVFCGLFRCGVMYVYVRCWW